MVAYLFLVCCTLCLVLQGANASRLVMQNRLRIERGFVQKDSVQAVFEGIRDETVPYPQDAVDKKLIKINADAGKSIDFSNTWDQVQTFRDIIYETDPTNQEEKVSGILRLQEMKQTHYEYAKMLVNQAVDNTVMEDGGTIHLYLSRPESSALANHTDTTDIFVLQLVGSKEWILCDNEASRLLDKNLRGKLDKCTTYTAAEMDSLFCERTTLYPGDALYLPKQVVHSARTTSDGLSAHLTFGFADNTCSVNEMDTCVAPQWVDHEQERRKLTCNTAEGGRYCNENCNAECDAACDSGFGTSSCNGSCDDSCDESCDICVPQICNSDQGGSNCIGSCDGGCNSACNSSCDSGCDGNFGTTSCNRGCNHSCTGDCTTYCNSNCIVCPTPRPTPLPTELPTTLPSDDPSTTPSEVPSANPSLEPTNVPSVVPSSSPTLAPTPRPSPGPTNPPTPGPTAPPSSSPSNLPSLGPSDEPTFEPSHGPTRSDSSTPTASPTPKPSPGPSTPPTPPPSASPSTSPSPKPSASPSQQPSQSPSSFPTVNQTQEPSTVPSITVTEIILAPEAAGSSDVMIYGISGGAAAVILLLVYFLCRKRKREVEEAAVEVKQLRDGTIKVIKTTKYKGRSRPHVEKLSFPNAPTANANGYFLSDGGDTPSEHAPFPKPPSLAPTLSSTNSPSQSAPGGEEEIPLASAIVPDDAGIGAPFQTDVVVSDGVVAAAAAIGASPKRSDADIKNREKKARHMEEQRAKDAARGSNRPSSKKQSRDSDQHPVTSGAFSSKDADDARVSRKKGSPRSSGGDNKKTSIPGAHSSNDADDVRVSRKSGKSSSSRSNRESGSSRSRSRRSSDEKSEARRHRSNTSGPSTPGAHHSSSEGTPRSRTKKEGYSSSSNRGSGHSRSSSGRSPRRSPSSRSSRSGGGGSKSGGGSRSRKVLSTGEVQELPPPPEMSEASTSSGV